MFVIDNEALLHRDAIQRQLEGRPSGLVEMITAEKIVDLAAARARLRPPENFVTSLTRTLANIDSVCSSRRDPTDG
jgi:hypothetical protein